MRGAFPVNVGRGVNAGEAPAPHGSDLGRESELFISQQFHMIDYAARVQTPRVDARGKKSGRNG